MMLCTGNMDRFCGCLTRPQLVPQNPDKLSAQNINSMKKIMIAGIANWSMSFLIAFRTILCRSRNPRFAILSIHLPR